MNNLKYFVAFLVLSFSANLYAQVPDWTETTCNNMSYSMHSELAAGNAVILKFSAVWCSKCNAAAPTVQQVYEDHGQGTGNVKVFGFLRDGSSFGTAANCSDLHNWDNQHNITHPGFVNINNVYNQYNSLYGNGGLPLILVFVPNTSNPGASTLVYNRTTSLGVTTGNIRTDINTVLSQNGFSPLSLEDELIQSKERDLVKVVDFMGRETSPQLNVPHIKIYSDGSTEKVMNVRY